jgi:hypothetical protein
MSQNQAPQEVAMDIVSAVNNVTNVVRAFSGNAETHELLAASLRVIRARIVECERLEQLLMESATTTAQEEGSAA